jgi:hypothetical protein
LPLKHGRFGIFRITGKIGKKLPFGAS